MQNLRHYRYILDIGTHSVRLLRARMADGIIIESEKCLRVTRLGTGVDASGRLSQDAIERTVRGAQELIAEYGVLPYDVRGFATSAVRDAANPSDILRRFTALGIPVEVLSGVQEAALGFMGAVGAQQRAAGFIDIGGGSTELVTGINGQVDFRVSLQLGVLRALERYDYGDPADRGQVDNILRWAQQSMEDATEHMPAIPEDWVGVGGTWTTLAAIHGAVEPYSPERISKISLHEDDLAALLKRLSHLSLAQRKQLPGLAPQRADVIVGGCAIALSAMRALGIATVRACDRDGLEGYLMYITQNVE